MCYIIEVLGLPPQHLKNVPIEIIKIER